MVRFAGQVEAPAAVCPDLRRDGDGTVEVGEAAPLLDVQFDECGEPAQRLGIGAGVGRVVSGAEQGLGEGGAVGVAQPACLIGV